MALTHSVAISVTVREITFSKHLAIRRETPSILFISWQIEL